MARGSLYSSNELRILWYLKRNGPIHKTKGSVYNNIADGTMLPVTTVRNVIKSLENKCMVIRVFSKGGPSRFGESQGNYVIRVELVDPTMNLPEPPKPIPTIVVDARENEELYEMTAIEPSPDAVILALLQRNEELQEQIAKLQDVIQQLASQQQERRKVPEHLTSRIRDALTPEQWEEISHSAKR